MWRRRARAPGPARARAAGRRAPTRVGRARHPTPHARRPTPPQVQSVYQGAVTQTLSAECLKESAKNVPAEFTPIRHVRGILSMGRMADPNSGGSSFSMLLGKAPHLDSQYTVFGRVVDGLDVLSALEKVETKREGIFVMPKDRIEISRAYVVSAKDKVEI